MAADSQTPSATDLTPSKSMTARKWLLVACVVMAVFVILGALAVPIALYASDSPHALSGDGSTVTVGKEHFPAIITDSGRPLLTQSPPGDSSGRNLGIVESTVPAASSAVTGESTEPGASAPSMAGLSVGPHENFYTRATPSTVSAENCAATAATTTAAARRRLPLYYPANTLEAPAVACSTDVCASVGKEILLDGGSAVDAAIAAHICAGLYEPQSAGLGGGLFMTVYEEKLQQAVVFNARETAPASTSRSAHNSEAGGATSGGRAIAVPGEVAGYWAAWQRYGRLPWKALFSRTIDLCEEGFAVSFELASAATEYVSDLIDNAAFRDEIFHGGRLLPITGGKLYRRRLCRTLRRIADNAASFYRGDLAEDVLLDVRDEGASWTAADLSDYRVEEAAALRYSLPNAKYELFTARPPSLGAVLGHALSVADGFRFRNANISMMEADANETSLTLHRIVESIKMGFSVRSSIGDMRFNNVTEISLAVQGELVAHDRVLISDDHVRPPQLYYRLVSEGGPVPDGVLDAGELAGVHTSVVDESGLAVALSSSIGVRFGCKRMGSRTGIIFNSAMADFHDVEAPFFRQHANRALPRARPASTLAPTIIVDQRGKVRMVTGATGGAPAISALVWTILNRVAFGLDFHSALSRPRLHSQVVPGVLLYERTLQQVYVSNLVSRGHVMRQMDRSRAGFVTSLMNFTDTTYYATPDTRAHGSVA